MGNKTYTHNQIEEQQADQNEYCTCAEPQPLDDVCAWCGGKMGMSKEVAECPLCTAAAVEIPQAFFAGGQTNNPITFVILQTKNMKGHEWRYMILTAEHVADIPNPGQAEAYLYYFMRGKGIGAFEIMEPTHSTITDHWHRVASDMWTGDDGELIDQTDRIQILVKKDARDRE